MTTELKELIQDCIEGKRAAHTQLYNRFAPLMFAICLRYSSCRQEAEDLLQEGFMKVYDSLKQYRFEGSFEGWMRRIFVNQAVQRIRKKSPLHALVSVETETINEPLSEEAFSKLEAKELMAMMQSLPTTYRLVFNLFVFEGFQHKEIAAMLKISEGTSKSNLYDARRWLKEKLAAAEGYVSIKKCL